MALFSKLESKLGLTRGDITVALFLAATALAGFIYTTFFDPVPLSQGRRELVAIRMRHDSIVAAHRSARLAGLNRSPADTSSGIRGSDSAAADTLPSWTPLTEEEGAGEEAIREASNPGGSGGRRKLSGPMDLNTASKESLMELPGVGEKTAEAIIERRKHVPFRRVEDIMEVKGIGEKKFEKMKPYIVVR